MVTMMIAMMTLVMFLSYLFYSDLFQLHLWNEAETKNLKKTDPIPNPFIGFFCSSAPEVLVQELEPYSALTCKLPFQGAVSLG